MHSVGCDLICVEGWHQNFLVAHQAIPDSIQAQLLHAELSCQGTAWQLPSQQLMV